MWNMTRYLLAMLCAATTFPAPADDDHEAARRLLEAGEVLPLGSILERADDHSPGHLLETELEREDGRWVYELEWLGNDGVVRELLYDATTGEFLGEELD